MSRGVELLAELEALGVEALPEGERLRLHPGAAVPALLLAELRVEKASLLEILRARAGDYLNGTRAREAAIDPAPWPLEEINRRGVVLAVASRVLEREVLFVPDGWRRPEGESRPAFAVSELRRLAKIRPTPAELRRVAEVRDVFAGRIIE